MSSSVSKRISIISNQQGIVVRGLKRRFEEEGDVIRKFWMRDVRRRMEEREEGKEKRLVEMRKKYSDEGFGKKVIGIRNDLVDLERKRRV